MARAAGMWATTLLAVVLGISVVYAGLVPPVTVAPLLVASPYVNADFTACSTDDPLGKLDPGYGKDVAWSECSLQDADGNGKYETIDIWVHNAYPYYTTSVSTVIHNGGTMTERISAVDVIAPENVLAVDYSNLVGTQIAPGKSVTGIAKVQLLQPAAMNATYFFQIKITVVQWMTGTIGFWGAWANHNTYSQSQIETWLRAVDGASSWLGPRTASGMTSYMDAARAGTAKQRFLGHYLATRLNAASGRLMAGEPHDIRGADPQNYLGLANPSSCTASQVFAAIESKYNKKPTDAQFLIMKSVCDGMNNRLF